MKIKVFQMSSGESYSTLLGEDGMPLPYHNLFVTLHYRNQSKASATCHRVFEHLCFLEEICQFERIDLIERCKTGDFLTSKEFENIKKYSSLKVESFRKMVARHKPSNVVNIKREKLETARAKIVISAESDISPHTMYNRLTVFAQFIGWLEEELFPSKDSSAEFELKKIRGSKFGTSDEALDWGEWRSLEPVEEVRVLDVVHPDSSENPWKSESVRYRNQLIVNMLFSFGCRRGELLKIRVKTDSHSSDIKKRSIDGRYFVMIRSRTDYSDKRKHRPEGKTMGRYVPMDKRLVDMYENYLIHHRPCAIGSEHIEYLFVTHNHKTQTNVALSMAQVNKIFREISEVVGFRVHPHSARHTWNDKFSKFSDRRIAEGKTTEAKSEADRQKLMGWAEGSKSAKRYSKRHDDKRAMDMALELQEEYSTIINSIVMQYDEDIGQ
ncbi:site-specific integrase [Vibrio coralliilyticus]|uniref:tyrosine-type recombinase/integrase n=1 Tax=Vibrio coralliilyticus TaxID=190893 RepID=UPI001560DDB5|nr:site-specific integrase [Vibrio coralliilyticus]NRF27098.1 site-specific integrase [Vibrio coralliilyticus]NRF81362.1 site-specific integrase [Vibrio coralliilyticus]